MTKQAYGARQVFLNEQIVRATTVNYVRERKGAAAADALIRDEVARGFLWTAPIAELLRTTRPRSPDFIQRLVVFLSTLE